MFRMVIEKSEMRKYVLEELPELTKNTLLNHFPERGNDHLWFNHPNVLEWRRDFTADEWYKIVEHYDILTDEIKNELMPYMLGAQDGV